jgi:glyoxylase-like metal-dependent hydrolase (beta-lactamase superfamily II)
MPKVQVQTVVSRPFMENTYLVWRDGSSEALVVDPGTEPDAVLAALDDHGLTAAMILNTHGHADHIAGNAALKQAFPEAPLVIGVGDAPMLSDPVLNLSAAFDRPLTSPEADRTVREGERVEVAGFDLEVLEIPGHSPGHVVYVQKEADGEVWVLGGDVLFRGGIGRFDFPGGDGELLIHGIRTKLFPLPAGTVVYPGHGPVTTTGHERRTNPFCSLTDEMENA